MRTSLSPAKTEKKKTTPQEKPSGDGSNGKTDNPLLTVLRLGREILLKDYSPDTEFRTGDIVFDEQHSEHGIVLGEKPNPVYRNLESLKAQTSYNFNEPPESRTMLLLTFFQEDEKETKSGTIRSFNWRIRYTNSRYIRKVDDVRNFHKEKGGNDLKFFCENQCIQDCSKECALWKYRRL